MKILSSVLCLLAGCVFWVSCTKKSDPAPNQPAKIDHLTSTVWKVEDVGLDQNKDGVLEQSILGFYPCLKDNTITFKKDNTGTTDDGLDKCNASTPQTSVINWSFADAESNLVVTNSSFAEINGKSKIVEVSSTSLILNKDTVFMGSQTFFSVRLKH